MARSSWLMTAAVIGAAGLMAACAQTGADTSASASSSASTSTSASMAAPDTDGSYTDDQLIRFIAARAAIEPISRDLQGMTTDERSEAMQNIQGILNDNTMSPVTYDAIQAQIQTDAALSQRVIDLQVQNVSDETLHHFVMASAEIEPVTAGLATATPEQREQASAQIGAILERHGLDANLYNAIATEAQTNQALAARIAAMQTTHGSADHSGG